MSKKFTAALEQRDVAEILVENNVLTVKSSIGKTLCTAQVRTLCTVMPGPAMHQVPGGESSTLASLRQPADGSDQSVYDSIALTLDYDLAYVYQDTTGYFQVLAVKNVKWHTVVGGR